MNEKTDNKTADEPKGKTIPIANKGLNDNQPAQKNSQSILIPKIPGSFVLPVLFLVMIIIILVSFNKRMISLENSLAEADNANASVFTDIKNRINNNLLRFSDINRVLEELETQQAGLSHLLSEPAQHQFDINKDYALIEIEHLLMMANHHLQLEKNVPTALAALQAADLRLKGLDDPGVLSVRKQLVADLNAIKSINHTELTGLGLYLSDLISRVDNLPLEEDTIIEPVGTPTAKQAEMTENNWLKRFFVFVWQELKSLVVITHNRDVNKVRLLPDEVYFLRANIKLELANARFAVFNRDTENLHVSTEHIQKWLNDYFDITDAAVANINETMIRMRNIDLTFPEVDISSSLESVRALMRKEDDYTDGIITP